MQTTMEKHFNFEAMKFYMGSIKEAEYFDNKNKTNV